MVLRSNLPAILKKNPKLRQVSLALEQYQAGEPITAACPQCGGPLKVQLLEEIDTLLVSCEKGCTTYKEKYAPGAVARRKRGRE